jgi:predicted nucleic acid-binding protein
MLVIDASALTELLVGAPSAPAVATHLTHQELVAPHVLDLEVLHALRRHTMSGQLPRERAEQAVGPGRPARRTFPHEPLVSRIWHLRQNVTPYDAAYLALAEALSDEGVPLLTVDARFARAATRHSHVEVLLAA